MLNSRDHMLSVSSLKRMVLNREPMPRRQRRTGRCTVNCFILNVEKLGSKASMSPAILEDAVYFPIVTFCVSPRKIINFRLGTCGNAHIVGCRLVCIEFTRGKLEMIIPESNLSRLKLIVMAPSCDRRHKAAGRIGNFLKKLYRALAR